MRVRQAEARDDSRIAALIAAAPEAASWAGGYPSQVVEVDGLVVGFALYRLVAGEGELLNLAVDPQWRRRGVASSLLEAILGEAELWHLEVRVSNQGARELYLAKGFIEVGRREKYYADGEAAVLMSRME